MAALSSINAVKRQRSVNNARLIERASALKTFPPVLLMMDVSSHRSLIMSAWFVPSNGFRVETLGTLEKSWVFLLFGSRKNSVFVFVRVRVFLEQLCGSRGGGRRSQQTETQPSRQRRRSCGSRKSGEEDRGAGEGAFCDVTPSPLRSPVWTLVTVSLRRFTAYLVILSVKFGYLPDCRSNTVVLVIFKTLQGFRMSFSRL